MNRPSPGRPARLADVARAAGVGTSIASRVLNGDPTVSIRPETRERILVAARALNYRPNALARGLKLARTMSLGLVVNLAYYPENEAILVGVERRAASAGYVTLVADASEFTEQGEAYRRLLFERRVDGIVIASALVEDELIRELAEESFPFVLVNRRLDGVSPSATGDDELGMRIAVAHLAGLGHRRIAFVAGPLTAEVIQRQLAGFHSGMRDAGLEIPPAHIVEATLDEDSGFRCMERLLALDPRPTAVVIWSPTTAVSALASARRRGLRLPGELSIVAHKDAGLAAYLDPPLTTVRMPLREAAEAGVDCLLRAIGGEPVESVVVETPPVLVERGSTAPAPAAGG